MPDPLLTVDAIQVVYDHVILAVAGVSLRVAQGDIVALLGANGAGKSSTLKAISNLLVAERGQVVRGTIRLRGASTAALGSDDLVARGVIQVLEGRHCFAHLTVEENLLTGALARRDLRRGASTNLQRIYGYFPRLAQKRQTLAGYISGGEQQMVAIGRALMARPSLVLLDEPSMGLAPLVVEEIFKIIGDLNRDEAVTFLVAEQNANVALHYATYAYILENGCVVLEGPAADLAGREDVKRHYLGLANPVDTARAA